MSEGFPDWLAITRVIARYARFADQRRFTEMAGLFVPDGRMLMFRPRAEEPAESPQGQEELIAAFSALAAFTVTTHALSPSDVEIGGGTARAHTTCMSHHISETGRGGCASRSLIATTTHSCDSTDDGSSRSGANTPTGRSRRRCDAEVARASRGIIAQNVHCRIR